MRQRIMNKLKEWYWKRVLTHRYLDFIRVCESVDCGNALASHVSLRYQNSKESCNAAIRKLNKINPTIRLKEIGKSRE